MEHDLILDNWQRFRVVVDFDTYLFPTGITKQNTAMFYVNETPVAAAPQMISFLPNAVLMSPLFVFKKNTTRLIYFGRESVLGTMKAINVWIGGIRFGSAFTTPDFPSIFSKSIQR
jgi:hypothetical protein